MNDVVPSSHTDIDHLITEAEQFVERRNPQALPLAHNIMKIAMHHGNPKYYAQAKYIMAFYNCMVVNDYDKAIDYCEEVLRQTDAPTATDVLYKIYMTMGNSLQLKGELFKAQECYLKGLKQLEAKKELSHREKGFLASFYYNLSILLSNTQLNISTEEYLEKAIEIFKEIDNGFKLSKSYVAFAGIYERRGQYLKAIEMLHKSLEIDMRMKDEYSISLSKANLGIMHLHLREFDRAFEYINESLNYYEGQNMLYEAAMVRVTLGEALCIIEKRTEGIQHLQEATEIFKRLDNKRELPHVYDLLSKFFEADGDLKNALLFNRHHTESLKCFFDVEKTKALTRAKKEFESEQKEKEAALLREKNEEIKHYVIKLESSNNELKQFAHVASHDLREPLRMITSYMKLLQKSMDGGLTTQQSEFMAFAVDGAKRMEQLIQEMLRLAKVDANPRIEKLKLAAIIEEVKLNLEMLLKEKRAIVDYSNLPDLMADKTMTLQLLQNIIGNGVKYNESKCPIIHITQQTGKDGVEISIADNGIGIPENLRQKAFQIFQRLHTAKEYPGTGMGLAICKKIVESMGGHIQISDNPSGGSIFHISLPNSAIAG